MVRHWHLTELQWVLMVVAVAVVVDVVVVVIAVVVGVVVVVVVVGIEVVVVVAVGIVGIVAFEVVVIDVVRMIDERTTMDKDHSLELNALNAERHEALVPTHNTCGWHDM
jgi:hypothetical protein